ncbi:MAG: hypothetical protein ACYDGR_05925 [Candidatus Dormibacteria bacterium]
MKGSGAVVLAVALTTSIAGCGGNSGGTASGGPAIPAGFYSCNLKYNSSLLAIGNFTILAGDRYDRNGKGTYTYDPSTKQVKFVDGPYAGDYSGVYEGKDVVTLHKIAEGSENRHDLSCSRDK